MTDLAIRPDVDLTEPTDNRTTAKCVAAGLDIRAQINSMKRQVARWSPAPMPAGYVPTIGELR